MVPFRGSLVAVGAAVLSTVGLTGCGGSSSGTTAAPPPTAAASSAAPTCPSGPPVKPAVWPKQVPADMPKPPGARIDDQQNAAGGVHIVKFTTHTSLRDSVLFVVQKFPKAGFVLGRGDAEASEADAPFVRGNTRGLVRMLQLGLCQTQWLLATVDTSAAAGNSPLLTPHSPSGSPSPLPFG